MSPTLSILCFVFALAGHFALWIGVTNRIHAVGWPRKIVKSIVLGTYLLMVASAGVAAVWFAWRMGEPLAASELPTWLLAYSIACIGVAVYSVAHWAWLRWVVQQAGVLQSNHTSHHDLRDVLGARATHASVGRWMVCVPGNQVLTLDENVKTLAVPGLPPSWDGLSIAHLSDLHYSGRVGREFFEEVIRRTNEMQADLVAITGDLVERAKYLDWFPDTLGHLESRLGVFAILGNHDRKVETRLIKGALDNVGVHYLGGDCYRMRFNGRELLLAGNELPWFGPAADVPVVDGAADDASDAFRILLAHSPDQFAWARERGFHLMLAGHTHGGQIRLPVWGPLVVPSLHGVRYASGTFYARPTTMHVTRGVSSYTPLRFFCRPELTKLVLRPAPLGKQAAKPGAEVAARAVASR